MKIRKFCGPSVNVLLREIRETLGSEVHLLETRMIRQPGILGFFKPRVVEISVAYEIGTENVPGQEISPKGENSPREEGTMRRGETGDSKMSGSVSQFVSPTPRGDELPEDSESKSNQGSHEIARLVELGVPRHAAKPLLRSGLCRDDSRAPERFPWLRGTPILTPKNDEDGPRIVALVGPTGAGKTTTCAKLAARLALGSDVHVGLVSLDTYRVGAVEQLRTYARILRAPLEVVMDPGEARPALRRMNSCEVVILDTTGRSHKDPTSLRRLATLLDAFEPDETHLVVGLNTDPKDANSIVTAYRTLDYNRILVTKLDETECPGKVVSLVELAGVPLSYVATGQDVPDDLETPAQAVPRLLREAMAE